jgi:IS30 family transposase
VIEGLEALWSPKEIAFRLRMDFPDDPMMWVSHETIYQSLYVQGRGELRRELTRCLRSGRAQRRPRNRMTKPRGKITNMVMISERPPEIEDRAVPGHWEGDLIIGKNNGSQVGTLVERSSRYVILLHLEDRRAETVQIAMEKMIRRLPLRLRRSLTWDQGHEMANHEFITMATGMQVYFCDPHSPWQRGSNENTNGLLRQYMPKGTDLSIHTPEDLQRYADSLNGRPRETLGFMKPWEKLVELIAQAS